MSEINPSYVDIAPASENVQGLSYGEWFAKWCQWALSSDPVYHGRRNEAAFLIGKLSGTVSSAYTSQDAGKFKLIDRMNIRAKLEDDPVDLSLRVFTDTPIIVDVLGAFYFVEETFDSTQLVDDQDCLRACYTDINEGNKGWFKIKKQGEDWHDCTYFLVESPFFHVTVPENAPNRLRTEHIIEPGEHDGVQVSYGAIITKLSPGTYFLRFGGVGRGTYYTDSLYRIIVMQPTGISDNTKDAPPSLEGLKDLKIEGLDAQVAR